MQKFHSRPNSSVFLFPKSSQENHTTLQNYESFVPWPLLPPNTEGSAEPSEAIGASLRTQVKIISRFCSHLPFPTAPPPPSPCPGTAYILYSFFYIKSHLIPYRNRNSPLPSFLSGGQNRNDDVRKNII